MWLLELFLGVRGIASRKQVSVSPGAGTLHQYVGLILVVTKLGLRDINSLIPTPRLSVVGWGLNVGLEDPSSPLVPQSLLPKRNRIPGSRPLMAPARVGGDGEAEFQSPPDSEAGQGPRATRTYGPHPEKNGCRPGPAGRRSVSSLNVTALPAAPARPCCLQVSNHAASSPIPKPNPQRQRSGVFVRFVSSSDPLLVLESSLLPPAGEAQGRALAASMGSQNLLALSPLLGGKPTQD